MARRQHGVVARRQLLELGFGRKAIEHRLAKGRLHRVHRGVYAVGRPDLTQHGRWMAAVLACGPGAVLSHESAAGLWCIRRPRRGKIELSVPAAVARRVAGVIVHRRVLSPDDDTCKDGIPVTSPICTLIDLSARLGREAQERAINEADKLDLTTPDELRAALDAKPNRPGVPALRATLDRRTFTLSASQLERRFLPIAGRAGLPKPETGVWLNGYEVDFYWPHLGLVVETDGLRYHRTPAEQARDRLRDQAHTAAGMVPLRFTHAQVRFDPARVEAVLAKVALRIRRVRYPFGTLID